MTAPILIFGGSGGIGAALAGRLLARGLPVHIAARDTERLAHCSAQLGGCRYTSCDAADGASLANAVAEASALSGGLSGLAWCVGSIVLKPLKRTTADDFLDAFKLNVLGAALAVQAAEQALRAARGSVVLFSSVAAGSGFPNHAAISAAKGAVEALTRTLAADLAPDVRVNCVAPSLVRTPLAAALTSSEQMAKSIAALHPLPRLGEAVDIAAAAAFFLTADSDWITGQVLSVDGGRATVRPRG
jgi:NAD(P)-dependent dehydrogenase (short-subunit alcohol dehydrogenase family)